MAAAVVQTTITATPLSRFSLSQYSFPFPSKPPTLQPPSLPSPLPFNPHRHPHFSTSSTAQPLLSPHPPLTGTQTRPERLLPLDSFNGSSSLQTEAVDMDNLFNLLRFSVRYDNAGLARAVHASILKLEEDTHLGNAVIAAYLKLGLLLDAYSVFMGLSRPSVGSYTALISSFAKSNREGEAIELFFSMRSSGIEANEYSFVAILTACIRVLDLDLGMQIHALAMKLGYFECVFVGNALLALYGNCGCLDDVIQLFDEMPQRDIASWNTVISSLVKELLYGKALELFRSMLQVNGFKVDEFTLSSILTACAGCHAVMEGRALHACAVRIELDGNLNVSNALIGFYTRCGRIRDVEILFDRMWMRDVVTWTEMVLAYMEFGLVDLAVQTFKKMPERNSISYNALMTGFCRNGEGLKALDLFIKMAREGAELTDSTLTSVINACGLLASLGISRQIHGFVIKTGFGSNEYIEAALLDMYTRCGRMRDAEKMFCSWPYDQESSIIQTSMLCGYARNGLPDEAIALFHRCQSEGRIVMDEVAFTSVLGVCGTLGFHEMGLQLHCQALKTGFIADLGVGNSMISMYSKCGNMNDAAKCFNLMPSHSTVSWNGLIAGHLLHRQGDEALAAWSRMKKQGIQPDAVTFILVISAYKHTTTNLVDDCRNFFFSIKMTHDLEPTSEHYASLVSVFGYWGLLEEAEETILKMPFEPEASVWRSVLDSCRLHSDTIIGKRVAKRILAMEPLDPSTYILVSNLYSASARWHCSEMVRVEMREKGLRKHPSRSWIIHQKKVHSFYARDKYHPQTKDIYGGLEILLLECMKAGYEPDTSFVLHETEEYQKKDFLFYHSAKLAATYGLLTTRPGEPIRIVKNVLLCGDCHTFLKHVSVVARRDIIVRDSSGFHFISNGQCSCRDYW